MKLKEAYPQGVDQDTLGGRSRFGRSAWHVCASVLCLGIASLLVATGRGVAQIPIDSRLTVQPRTMATGTKNPATGEYPLDSVTGAIVSVPPQCVGAKRCPLLVQLPGGGQPASVMTGWMRPVANKYGFVLLAVSEGSRRPAYVDAALREVLRRFAIDPEKIAIAGRCASGEDGMTYGIQNLHIFNRIISVSGGVPVAGMDPRNTTAQFLIDRGFHEIPDNFAAARALRKDGHPVTVALAVRWHEHQGEDYDFVGHWLEASWRQPNPAKRPAPQVMADPLPELTTEALTKMTAFWTSFAKEPDSIRLTARRAFLHEVLIPVGQERPSVWITDMPALAAKHPSVATDLKNAGLTARQHDAYRAAIFSAMITALGGEEIGTIDTTSVLAKNMAFLSTHADESKALESAGIEHPTMARELGGCCTNPQQVDRMGPMGIWHTP